MSIRPSAEFRMGVRTDAPAFHDAPTPIERVLAYLDLRLATLPHTPRPPELHHDQP